ncbi:MAG: DCC1-like thiol-disulfide oxidoreductase family protein [Actinomycetota bacterium]
MNRIRPGARGTLVFDGDCAFCSSSARFVRGLTGPSVRVVPYQRADLVDLGLTREQGAEAVWFVHPGGRKERGHRAIAAALNVAGGIWRPLGSALEARSVSPIASRLYDWVARNRHRLPGGTPECGLPSGQLR